MCVSLIFYNSPEDGLSADKFFNNSKNVKKSNFWLTEGHLETLILNNFETCVSKLPLNPSKPFICAKILLK